MHEARLSRQWTSTKASAKSLSSAVSPSKALERRRLGCCITIALMPELQHGNLIQLVDNQPAVACLDRRTAKDPRFQDLNTLTEAQLKERSLRTATRWISTTRNEWADLISRGEIDRFKELARAAGAQEIIEVGASATEGPPQD